MIIHSVVLSVLIACGSSGGGDPLIRFSDLRRPPPPAESRYGNSRDARTLLRFRKLRAHDTSIAGEGSGCRVAVIGFHNAGGKEEHDWLSRELADSLVAGLDGAAGLVFVDRDDLRIHERRLKRGRGGNISRGQITSLSRTSGADVVLVGRYCVEGSTLRIDIQTMRPSRGALSKVLRVSGVADRVWEIEGEMTGSVADLLGVRLSDGERERLSESPTESPVAFREYRKSEYAPEGSHRKIEHLQRAIEADPGFAVAHYHLGNAYKEIGTTYQYVEWFNKALDSYRKAVAIDPDYAEAYCGMGIVYMLNGRYTMTRKAMEKAVRITPSMTLAGSYLRRLDSMGY